MIKQYVLIAFDCEGNKIKLEFDSEREALQFCKDHNLEYFSITIEYYGTSL